MRGQLNRTNTARNLPPPDAGTMRTIIATVLAVLTAMALISLNTPPDTANNLQLTEPAISEPVAVVATAVVEQVVAPVAVAPEPPTCAGEITKYSEWNHKVAHAVMMAESTNDARAVGDTTLTFVQDGITYGASYGCFQIRYLPGRPTPEKLLDPVFNVEYAHNMYMSQGWTPWSAYNNGKYAKYLK